MAAASPGVSLAEFEDNAGTHAPAVDALDRLGVFEGTTCGEELFCPSEPILRWVMAVWLVRLLDDSEPQANSSRFVDVDEEEWWMPHVERLADLGITNGCASEPARFCPEGPVTRAQMASFLSRAFELEVSQSPPEIEFTDVGEGVHTGDIYALAASGITVGCAAEPEARYCPYDPTTRGQMASFLKRAYTSFVGPCPTEVDGTDGGGGVGVGVDGGGGGVGVDGGGGGGGPISVVPPSDPPELGAPESLTINPGDRRLSITWSRPDIEGLDIIGYRVQWKGPGQGYSNTERWDVAEGLSFELGELDNGTTYSVRVAAGFSGYGFGPAAEASGVPSTVPDAPRTVKAVPGDHWLYVSWSAPSDTGGLPVLAYRLQWMIAGVPVGDASTTGSGHRIGHLSNGVSHRVRVAAVNASGQGAWSEAVEGVPVGPPEMVGGPSAARGDNSVIVEWAPPSENGGRPVSGYKLQWRAYNQGFNRSTRQRAVHDQVFRYRIPNLANGTEHWVRVQAVNSFGDGLVSEQVAVVPAAAPRAPDRPRADRGSRMIRVTWRAPSDDGGAAITGHVVQWSDDEFDQSLVQARVGASVFEHPIEGLVNGTEYSLRVLAVNSVGDGAPSPVALATPATTPGAPGVQADPGDGVVIVSWSKPDDGGSDIGSYRVQRSLDDQFDDSDPVVTVDGGLLSRQISGLVNGTEYWVRVRAVNELGRGPWSSTASATPAQAADSPRGVTAAAASESVTVSWSAPVGDGGSPTGYKVQWRAENERYDPTRQALVGAAVRSHAIGDLTNGTRHFVRVLAVYTTGNDAVSAEAPFTPATPPGAPGIRAGRGNGVVIVSWSAPDDGGSDIGSYRVQRSLDDQFEDSDPVVTVDGDVLSRRISGLVNGTEYWVRVRAVSGVGGGPWSSTASAIPATVPTRPQRVAFERAHQSVRVAWAPPASDGGAEITGYAVQWTDVGFDQSPEEGAAAADSSEFLVEGLTNGRQYSLRMRALNEVGDGSWSSVGSATPATVPDPPEASLAVHDRALTVSWTAPDNRGEPISRYTVRWSTDAQFEDSDPSATAGPGVSSRRIAGLANATEYWVQVRARSGAGSGPWSSARSATPTPPPLAPRSLEVDPADAALAVAWLAPGASVVGSYRVQWSTDNRFSDTDPSASTGDTSYRITGLSNGTGYWVRVQAVNGAGTSPFATATSSVSPRTVPGPPAGMAALASSETMFLSWDPPGSDGGSAVIDYRVQWKGPGQEYSGTERQATVTALRHQITGLATYREYTARVQARNIAGRGEGAEISRTPAPPPGRPRSGVVSARNGSLVVSWAAPGASNDAAITEYRVLWKAPGENFVDSACSPRSISVPSSGDLLAVIGPLRNGTAYDIRILAANTNGPGDGLDISGVPVAVPGPPRGVGAFSVENGLHLDWDAPWAGGSPITSYRVQWKGPDQEYNDSDRRATVGGSTLSHQISGLTNGTEYTVRVVAVNANGDSRVWPAAACSTAAQPSACDGGVAEATAAPGDAPGAPTSITSSAHRSGSLSLRCNFELAWTAPGDTGGSEITRYRVQWRRFWEDGYSQSRDVTDLDDLTFSWSTVSWDCGFRFRITAINSEGAGPPVKTSVTS